MPTSIGMRIFWLLLTGLLVVESAWAGGFGEASFGMRLQAALTRFSRYPDVAGSAGASAAAKWGSAANPAGTAWLSLDGISSQYSRIAFDNGTDIDVISASYSKATKTWGAFQPSLGYAWSDHATIRDGLGFEYETLFAELQWGVKTSEKSAIGFNFNFADADLKFTAGPVLAVKSTSQTYGFRLGGLYQVVRPLRLGLAVDYAATPSRTTLFDLGSGDFRLKDTIHQILVRPGIVWEYAERSRFYLDYQFGLFTDDTDTLHVQRFFIGVDQKLAEFLAGRAGTVVDTNGNLAFTAGLGIFPSRHIFIDVAYQYFMFPEVERELGRSHGFGIAVSVAF